MAREDDRGGGFDDLFEDLDRFFSDEPLEGETEPPAPPVEASAPERTESPVEEEAPPPEAASPAGEPPTRTPSRDWRRLQDVLGEEEDGREFDLPSEVSEFDDEVEQPGEGLAGLRASRGSSEGRGAMPGEAGAGPGGPGEPKGPLPATNGASPSDAGSEAEEEGFLTDVLWDERTIEEVGSAADDLTREFDAPGPEDAPIVAGTAQQPSLSEPAPSEGPPEPSTPAGRPPSAPLGSPTSPPGPRTIRVTEPEDVSEPSFRPPPRRGFAAALQPSADSRNLPAAVFSGVVLAAVGLTLLAWKSGVFALVVVAPIVLIAQAELYRAMQRRGHQPATALGLVMGALTLAGAYWRGEEAMLLFVSLTSVLSFLWFLVVHARLREHALANMGLTVLGVVYVPLLAGYILVILSQANEGRAVMLAVLALTFLYDVSAFVVGSNWGRRPLAPSISPKKTWEGLVGATVVTFLVAVIVLPLAVGVFSFARAVGLFVVVAVFAPLGDLAESSIKRDLGVKDMGAILPGHGGALDRIDSVLFVAPFAFYFFRLFF
jgi:phosphatidate cytidylyltransferase